MEVIQLNKKFLLDNFSQLTPKLCKLLLHVLLLADDKELATINFDESEKVLDIKKKSIVSGLNELVSMNYIKYMSPSDRYNSVYRVCQFDSEVKQTIQQLALKCQ